MEVSFTIKMPYFRKCGRPVQVDKSPGPAKAVTAGPKKKTGPAGPVWQRKPAYMMPSFFRSASTTLAGTGT